MRLRLQQGFRRLAPAFEDPLHPVHRQAETVGDELRFAVGQQENLLHLAIEVDHRYTNAYVEQLNGLLDRMGREAYGLKLPRLRAKALLRYGDVKPLIDTAAFDLMSLSPEEREEIMLTNVGHGVDLSTFERDLRGGAFW